MGAWLLITCCDADLPVRLRLRIGLACLAGDVLARQQIPLHGRQQPAHLSQPLFTAHARELRCHVVFLLGSLRLAEGAIEK